MSHAVSPGSAQERTRTLHAALAQEQASGSKCSTPQKSAVIDEEDALEFLQSLQSGIEDKWEDVWT